MVQLYRQDLCSPPPLFLFFIYLNYFHLKSSKFFNFSFHFSPNMNLHLTFLQLIFLSYIVYVKQWKLCVAKKRPLITILHSSLRNEGSEIMKRKLKKKKKKSNPRIYLTFVCLAFSGNKFLLEKVYFDEK